MAINEKMYNKAIKPSDSLIAEILGKSNKFWKELKDHIKREYKEVNEEWKFYSIQSGWVHKLLLKKRNLFFMRPADGRINVNFVFGDKAIEVIEKSNLPQSIITQARETKKYMEGRGIVVAIHSKSDLDIVKKLIKIKIEN